MSLAGSHVLSERREMWLACLPEVLQSVFRASSVCHQRVIQSMSSRVSSACLPENLQSVFRASSACLQRVFSVSSTPCLPQHVFSVSSTACLPQHVFSMSSTPCLQRVFHSVSSTACLSGCKSGGGLGPSCPLSVSPSFKPPVCLPVGAATL